MTPIFTINFRREVYQRELARTRRRLIMVGGWVGYFGLLVIVIGLYGLNCVSLTRRVGQIERQAAQLRAAQNSRTDWQVGTAELAAAQKIQANPRVWRDKLVRLTQLLPINVALGSVAVNPDNASNVADQNKLVITGQMRVPAGVDRMRGVVQLVTALQGDSTFSSGYRNIRLASSRITESGGSVAEFVIECR
jgi:hypothetical protein